MLCSTGVGRWRREKYVAVKARSKFTDTKKEQTSASNEVPMELDHLCALKGKDGIAQLLSHLTCSGARDAARGALSVKNKRDNVA